MWSRGSQLKTIVSEKNKWLSCGTPNSYKTIFVKIHQVHELQRVNSCDSISSVINYIIVSCCSVNGHIEACLSSKGLAIELELHQYSLDHYRALFVSLATTRLILSLFLGFFSSISQVFKGIQILPAVWRK